MSYQMRKNSTEADYDFSGTTRKSSQGEVDYDFSNSGSNNMRPPATPNRQFGGTTSKTPRGMMANQLSVPSTPQRNTSGMGVTGMTTGYQKSPRTSVSAPNGGAFQMPPTLGARAGSGIATPLGGQPLMGGTAPRNMFGAGMPLPAQRTNQMPVRGSVDSKTEFKTPQTEYPSRLATAGSFIGVAKDISGKPRDALSDLVGGPSSSLTGGMSDILPVVAGGLGPSPLSSPPEGGGMGRKVTVPRPFVAPPPQHAMGRTAGGAMISPSRTPPPIVEEPEHVPRAYSALSMLEQTDTEKVGPDNTTKALNDVWSACWDAEVNATYYYNHQTGEATWIKPENL
eukprot:CAMPEP_0182425976 /NCGR_PEP_ID=MMETSP1167-20130531/12455_1 /TAXON_ID=2988 /ORGANISM="Mallomonas Sp, Strain CCMP3275" /LENGTH=339 /DNA_ID=CAMNT_0024607087 /DNA_START=154 /DNA_END=1173 /DNA_ORIENTATION=-